VESVIETRRALEKAGLSYLEILEDVEGENN
jgi:hypothetical protein